MTPNRFLGSLALMMFQHSRRNARTSPSGELILLDDQDRSKWDRAEISQAEVFLKRALSSQRMGRYTCEASIAQVHAAAKRPEETDWAKIVQLYDVLLEIDPSPIIELNRAAAIAMRDGPAAGLAIMNDIIARGALNDYRFAHAARADMLPAHGTNRRSEIGIRARSCAHTTGDGTPVYRAENHRVRLSLRCKACKHAAQRSYRRRRG